MVRRAFTLIELLVVIAVIALLVSLLLPALSGARDAGRAAVCAAHIRSLGVGVAVYEADNKGAMVGPNGSGSDLQQNLPYVPGTSTPTQDWDFISPLLGEGLNLPTDQLAKFQEICMTKFRCPSNTKRYLRKFQGADLPMAPTQPFVLSYMTPGYFQLYPAGTTMVNGRSVEAVPGGEPIALPSGYVPRIDLVGTLPSKKVLAFEGTRYYDPAFKDFDYSTVTNSSGLETSPQGNFTSRGTAFRGLSGEFYERDIDRGFRPNPMFKAISLRHDEKMNAVMFDGHVERLNNRQSSDPTYFLPTRSKLLQPNKTWFFYLGPFDSPLKTANAVIQ